MSEAVQSNGPHSGNVFGEWRAVGGNEPLRQGDVLEHVGSNAGMWSRHLVVITADCDFAYAKHQGRVTCVPLLLTDEYLREFQIPAIRTRLADKRVQELAGVLSEANGPRITPERLRLWPSESSTEEILLELRLPESLARRALHAFEALRLIDAPTRSVEDAVANLVESRMQSDKPPKREGVLKEVSGWVTAPFRHPPGDAMFLSAIAPGNDEGYFAYLRHLEQPWEPVIAITATRREHEYRRIARLHERYIHALVLRFATVFMSVGLPDEYEGVRDLHAMVLEERFV